MQRAENERRRSDEMVARAKEVRDGKIKSLEQRFIQVAPVVESAITRHCSLGKHGTIKGIGMFGLVLTAPFHLGLGLALADKFDPCELDDGIYTAKKLSREEVANVREFYGIAQQLKALDALSQVAGNYYRNHAGPVNRHVKGGYLISYENSYGTYYLSGLINGVFSGLGLLTK